MAVQTWMYALIAYFLFFSIFIGVLSYGGMMDEDVSVSGSDRIHSFSANESVNVDRPESTSVWSAGDYFSDLFSFFDFRVDLFGAGIWNWIIRLVFGYLPLTMLVFAIWYSLPTVSGG